MAPNTSHHLAQTVFGSDKLNVAELYKIKGQVALVTGGGSGLGLVTAAALAQNGCKVYITGRRGDVLEQAAKDATPGPETGGEVIPIQADVSDKEGIDKLKAEISKREKFLNVLINSKSTSPIFFPLFLKNELMPSIDHGVSLGAPPINEADQTAEGLSKMMYNDESMEKWMQTYQINCASYYFTSFAFLPFLAAAKTVGNYSEPGNIINIASISGITYTSQRGQFNYNASKAGTISLSKQLACEFARRDLGVRVNGYFPSGMTSVHPDQDKQEFRQNMGIPFARPGNAIDYAQTVIGIMVNKYQTGSEVVVDGGWLLQMAF
ncbi:hypothetical protein NliqN6_3140 [Naganishia liquefaciens]|uniref:SDR family oxidoreductase n=1 Tax=Naganishia liquefaciens TaxID=104408 RepID=A0A8H3YEY6_9TREE|nr:hypothetical protein NliqN6_3140 [Naganishia liquefaciens]